MEDLVTYSRLFNGVYNDKRVFLTGNTGFKGSWLEFWLKKMGAVVYGYSLNPDTNPNHFNLLNVSSETEFADINHYVTLKKAIDRFRPDIVFHLAAQSLVSYSYKQPLLTILTNVTGTANLLEACRYCSSVKAIVVITSDKCYAVAAKKSGYEEQDQLGGNDPYSASKACAEIVANSYKNSFFNSTTNQRTVLMATARAGNVIGGGDWADDRLIPDIVKAAYENKELIIRNPDAVRPWQHVLEPLSGYLLLGQKLIEEKSDFAEPWNFGPASKEDFSVDEILNKCSEKFKSLKYSFSQSKKFNETKVLNINSSKAFKNLQWGTIWNFSKTLEKTLDWYHDYYENGIVNTGKDLNEYILNAKELKTCWTDGI